MRTLLLLLQGTAPACLMFLFLSGFACCSEPPLEGFIVLGVPVVIYGIVCRRGLWREGRDAAAVLAATVGSLHVITFTSMGALKMTRLTLGDLGMMTVYLSALWLPLALGLVLGGIGLKVLDEPRDVTQGLSN